MLNEKLINEKIAEINDDSSLTTGDRRARFDALLKDWPMRPMPELFQTSMEILPGGILRAVSVSGQQISENDRLEISEAMSVLMVYELGEDKHEWLHASALEFDAAKHFIRHVDILGPSWVHHDPAHPIGNLKRRSCVMLTKSPLRLFLDTQEQVEKWAQSAIHMPDGVYTVRC